MTNIKKLALSLLALVSLIYYPVQATQYTAPKQGNHVFNDVASIVREFKEYAQKTLKVSEKDMKLSHIIVLESNLKSLREAENYKYIKHMKSRTDTEGDPNNPQKFGQFKEAVLGKWKEAIDALAYARNNGFTARKEAETKIEEAWHFSGAQFNDVTNYVDSSAYKAVKAEVQDKNGGSSQRGNYMNGVEQWREDTIRAVKTVPQTLYEYAKLQLFDLRTSFDPTKD